MEGQIEPAVRPKKEFVLDTDWMSAAGMSVLLIICTFLFSGTLMHIVQRNWHLGSAGWPTWACLGLGIWLLVIARERILKLAILVLLLGPVTRIALWAVKATPETQLVNAALLSAINLALYAGAFVYVIWWFKSRIRYV